MKKQIKLLLKFLPILSSMAFFPFIASAQATSNATDLLYTISKFFNSLLPVLVSLGVIYFVWGVVQYVINDSEVAKKKGKDRIISGIIGLAVIISVWGLVYVITGTLGFGKGGQYAPPNIGGLVTTPTSSSGCLLNSKLQGLLDYATCIIGKSVIPFLFALAVVMFIWGAVKFLIINAGEEKKREEGKQFMIWGIIALAVMISIWGLVGVLGDTFFPGGSS